MNRWSKSTGFIRDANDFTKTAKLLSIVFVQNQNFCSFHRVICASDEASKFKAAKPQKIDIVNEILLLLIRLA